MQIAVIVLCLILCATNYLNLHLKSKEFDNKTGNKVKRIMMSGVIIGIAVPLTLFNPVPLSLIVTFGISGLMTSQTICFVYLLLKKLKNHYYKTEEYSNNSPARFFITGDKHRNFDKVKIFCKDMKTRKKDVLIILGDTGFNYFEDSRDEKLKNEILKLKITLFCIHGNKENRPQNIGTYGIKNFFGGKVYYEPKYPNLLFAIDGEVYNFEGRKYLTVGGAHSVDKTRCLEENKPFWEDEMPNDETKNRVEKALENENYNIYGFLTHTCPIDYLPTEMFMSTAQNNAKKKSLRRAKSKKAFKPDIDRSTEEWLGKLEKKSDYTVWYCGHYHIDKEIDKVHMLYNKINPLHTNITDG